MPCAVAILCFAGCTVESPVAKNGDDSTSASVSWKLIGETLDESPQDATRDGDRKDDKSLRIYARRALDACGGDEVLQRLNRGQLTMDVSGSFGMGMEGDVRIVDTFDGPSKFRREIEGKLVDGEPVNMVFIINGNDAWVKPQGGKLQQLPSPENGQDNILLASFKALKAMADGEFWLNVDTEVIENPEGLTPVALTSEEGYHGIIAFSNETNLATASIKVLYDYPSASDVALVTTYSDHVTVDGILIPTKIQAHRDDELLFDTTILSLELLDVVDSSSFERPESN